MLEFWYRAKAACPKNLARGNKYFKTHPNPFLTFSVTHLEASLLYVMFQAALKVKTWNSGLTH